MKISADGNEILNERQDGDCGYIVQYKNRKGEVYAPTRYQAQLRAASAWKVKKDCEVSTHLAEDKTGTPVVHSTAF